MFKVLFLLVSIFSTIFAANIPGLIRASDGRIVGGAATTIEFFPHQISLRYFGSHRCGGSIIRQDVILIAAHCTLDIAPRFFQIVAGITYISKDKGVVRQVKSKIEHEEYDENVYYNDVGLLWLEEGFQFGQFIQPIGLASTGEKLKAGTMVWISGWGTLSYGGPASDQLQAVYVTVIGNKECQEMYEGSNPITEAMMCTGEPFGGRDACQGDSGGAVIAGKKVFGIVSHGVACALPEYPGVHADVGYLRPWIDSELARNGMD